MNKKQETLRERAKKISLNKTVKISSEKEIEVLDFVLSGETYCVETLYTVEVHREFKIVKVPTAPQFVSGIFNTRGKIITVIDLKFLLNIKTDKDTDKGFIIVIADNDKEFAFHADSLGGIRYIKESSIINELPTLSTYPEDYIIGIDNNNAVILNAKKIVNDQNLVVNEKAI